MAGIGRNTFWLSRILFLRSLGMIYSVAFLVALHQNRALIGGNGLMPMKSFLGRVESQLKTAETPFGHLQKVPTIFWFIERSDENLDIVASSGLGLSILLFFGFGDNGLILLVLWGLYHSIVNVGQTFYGFGWESQLLETGFLAIFMCPFFRISSKSSKSPPSRLVWFLLIWLEFRIMIGAGLIKIRAKDSCWLNLTCLRYHYETQPNPNPLSWLLHQQSANLQSFGVVVNHFLELIVPSFLLIPYRPMRLTAGIMQILFQIILIVSGNLSFLNWLTILPSIAALDDRFLSVFFPKNVVSAVSKAENELSSKPSNVRWISTRNLRYFVHSILFLGIGFLSWNGPIQNLLSERQIMNTSFDSLRLVNTYGAFGHVGKERNEVIISGTYDSQITENTRWIEFEFKCKPGNTTRRPCIISPYHYRLDWQIWFAGFPPHSIQRHPWIAHLVGKLLLWDEQILNLLDPINHVVFPFGPPIWIKADMYRYEFTNLSEWNSEFWWKRSKFQEFLPPLNLNSEQLHKFLKAYGWTIPRKRRVIQTSKGTSESNKS
uniref:Lipase maturation factor n=1 Tax=Hirondellea gigas TaxID=1518452 RepID=A0A6A7G303_9CRUS